MTEKSEVFFGSPDAKHEDQPASVQSLGQDLLKIVGVYIVNIRPYEVEVFKGEAFTWDEIAPQVKAVLAKHAPKAKS